MHPVDNKSAPGEDCEPPLTVWSRENIGERSCPAIADHQAGVLMI